MRVLLTLALAGHCAADGRAAGPAAAVTGIHVETSEGAATSEDQPRLDLGAVELWSTGDTTGGSSSTGSTEDIEPTTSGGSTTTSAGSTGSSSTGGEESTGASSTSGSSTGDTSTGGDDTTGEPLTDCPCQDGADNVCDLPPGTCSATLPGGLCDPDGDGAYFDGDWTLGYALYAEKCG